MPNRILREAILDSEAVDKLKYDEEVFYRRLMSKVDDFGRFDARPAILRSACFPLRVDTIRVADISRWLAACETAGLIVLYGSETKPFLVLLKLGEPRAKHSKYPNPPASPLRASEITCAQAQASVPYSNALSNALSDSLPNAPAPPFAPALSAGEALGESDEFQTQIHKFAGECKFIMNPCPKVYGEIRKAVLAIGWPEVRRQIEEIGQQGGVISPTAVLLSRIKGNEFAGTPRGGGRMTAREKFNAEVSKP